MWVAVVGDGVLSGADAAAAEAFCVQVARLRDAQQRVDAEGAIVADEKGRPVPHPALAMELAASAEMRLWVARRPDLFGGVKKPEASGGKLAQLRSVASTA